jgi:hypothetical protein
VAEIKGKHIFLAAAFVVIIFGVGLAQMGIELTQGERPQFLELFVQRPTEANLRAFEKDLEETCWFSEKLRPWTQYLHFVILKDAGDKALIGRQGWLFYKPGVQYLVEPWPIGADFGGDKGDVILAILSFRDQLADRGIELLVVPAPGKASVYPEKLAYRARKMKRPLSTHTLKIISALEEAEVEVVNLFEVFSQARARKSAGDRRYYLSQDTHWSPAGVRLAAKVVGQKVLELGWAKQGTVEYDLKPVTIKRYGDVPGMMQVPQIERCFVPEEVHCTQVVNAESGKPYEDDPDSEILVLGDSFLRIYEQDEPGSGGFIAHLAKELKRPLASIVNDGGASTLVRQQLSRRPALLARKKLVIWEFVERDIRFGTEGWQQVTLAESE